MLRQLTVGVIGHVNHGKTSLVKALTGTDTDRLEEEQRRGMSIALGFAHLALANGLVDLIDVPGHEQFVRTMVAGATGIAATLLVVNAREGVKPQTVEHLAIAQLVGVPRGVVAISKADLADAAQRVTVRRALRGLLRDTHLEFAPVVFTSATTGEGLDELRLRLAHLLQQAEPPATGTAGWLPVDRVFTLAGHGTVVTGTLRGGPLRAGDTLAAWPHALACSVRQLQVHNAPVTQAWPGQRVGVNLRHVGAAALARGDVLAPPGRLQAGVLLDVDLRLMAARDAATLDGQQVRLLCGTTEVGAVVRVLGRAGAEGAPLLAQLRTARPLATVAGEAFILRRESPPSTLGGGRILDASPPRHRRYDSAALQRLHVLAGGTTQQRLVERLRAAGAAGLPLDAIAGTTAIAAATLAQALEGCALVEGQQAWLLEVFQDLQERMVDALTTWHQAHPLLPDAPLSLCRSALPSAANEPLYRRLLQSLQDEGRIAVSGGRARLSSHDPLLTLDPRSRGDLLSLEAALREGGMQPPDPPTDDRLRALFGLLVASGKVLLLPGQPPSQRIALHRDALGRAGRQLQEAFPPPNGFTVSQARELLGSTRKFTVPLLQHLQASGQTRRHGDCHMFVARLSTGGE